MGTIHTSVPLLLLPVSLKKREQKLEDLKDKKSKGSLFPLKSVRGEKNGYSYY
jgi:hypothetical protein